MSLHLKQSTAVVVSFGPFVDKTDGVTPETGLVSALDHASTGIKLSKNGGALTIRNAAVTATTYDGYGNYRVTLDTTDTNTLGTLRIQFIETATCLPVWLDCMVLPANIWDSLYGADLLQVDVTQLLGTAWLAPGVAGTPDVNVKLISADATAADNAEAFFDGTGYAGTGNTIPTVTTVGTLTTYTGNTPQTGDSFARIGAAGASLTDLGGMSTTMKAQVETEVDDALGGGTGTALTAVPWNAAWDAEVQSEVDDAIVAQRLDELLNADSDIDGAAPPTVGSVVHELLTKTAGSFTYDQTTDSLEALRDRGDAAWVTGAAAPTAAAVADAVWDEANADHLGAGSTGLALSGASAPSAATVADAVWDELLAGHAIAGSAGQALSAAGGAADPLLNAVPGAYVAGSAGYNIGLIDDIKAKTDLISSGAITVSSPVSASGTEVEVIQGDDYLFAESRQLPFNSASWSLTGNTVNFYVVRRDATVLTVAAVIVDATNLYVPLTAAQTAALAADAHQFSLVQTNVATHKETLLRAGVLTVRTKPNP